MKKHLWIFAAAAAALAACSNDDTIAVNQGYDDASAISFRVLTTGMTRAVDQTSSTLQTNGFYVTANKSGDGTEYFGGKTATETLNAAIHYTWNSTGTNANSYTTENKYYWPSEGDLDFIAYAPAAATSSDIVRTDTISFTVSPASTPAEQKDLVFAVTRNQNKTANGAGVILNFRHAESKVAILLKNTNNNLKFTVGTATIGNLKGTETFTWNGVTDGTTTTAKAAASTTGNYEGTGTITYLNGTWTATSAATTAYTTPTATNSTLNGTTDAQALGATATNYDMILIPQAYTTTNAYASASENAGFNGAYIKVQLKIQNKANDAYIAGGDGENSWQEAIWPLTPILSGETNIGWLPGHKYTYTVDLAGGGYYPTNKAGTDEKLDPILDGAEIKFVTVTVDAWPTTATNTDIANANN